MNLVTLLKHEAVRRGLLTPDAVIDAPAAFYLVRDMRYQRASDRQPETLIREWRGTCSGKHYLLKALFAELGLVSHLIACTTETRLDPATAHERLRPILERASGRVVDVHNYLMVDLPEGEMVVDATWPLSTLKYGLPVNEHFVLGQSQVIASPPVKVWIVPPGSDPQDFKDELLKENFTDEELDVREAFILTLGDLMAGSE